MEASNPHRAGFDSSTDEVTQSRKPLFIFLNDPSLDVSAQVAISLRRLPFLRDHAFQDLVVLPGSFYIELALSVYQQLYNCDPGVIRNVTFQNPVILSSEDTILEIEVQNSGSSAEYTFYEGAVRNGAVPNRRQYAARLEIERMSSAVQDSVAASFTVQAFQARSDEVIDSKRFYEELWDNGNQYGPLFQSVSSIWRVANQSLGRLSWPAHAETVSYCLRPILLDSMTQMLAPFMMARKKTFILRSIERIEIANLNFSSTLWCHATVLPAVDVENVVGNIRVFGTDGKMHLDLFGVNFNLVEPPESTQENYPVTTLVVASNFTADPIEDSLRFWAAHFNYQSKIEFAPYDQIFQELLKADSAFQRNSAGVNIILLQLEKWGAAEQNVVMNFDKKRAEECFGKRKTCILPNGLEIVHLNQYETTYLYQEIFEDRCYVKHGITLPDGATVLDIGANIGLFSLFAMSRCKNPRIYAFEPAPVAYDILKANCEVYDSNSQVFNCGVSDRQGSAILTFYENSSVFSGFRPDEAQDREAIQAVVRNMLNAESLVDESVQEYVKELTTNRLRRSTHECRLTTVSDIIRENHINRIDLLKIDAEKSELDIIRGIADCDWAKIDQIVMEVHDSTGEVVRQIKDVMIRKGYRCAIEQEKLLKQSGLFNLFATRDAAADGMRSNPEHLRDVDVPEQMTQVVGSLQRNVEDFCAALQSFASHATAPLVLCFCPPSPAVETDAKLKAAVGQAEREILSQAGTLAGVSTISSETLFRLYPVEEYYDNRGLQLGDIPYTPECYSAIGTALFRAIFNLKRKPFKVIVLDCDHTLWKGVCGEDSYQGVAVTDPHRALQQFMIEQMNAGMLLCLCSKNNEQDVMDVFDRRADMLLKRAHLASWRINWSHKSENIKSLADELNLSLDSFIFIDDNPVDCADVEINCPGVLTLRLPQNPATFVSFLEHIWAFDHIEPTEEDRQRARMYQDNVQRERFRAQSPSLGDFIASLKVRIEIAEVTEDQLSRASQLTFRTNQFNFTTIRRSPSEIRDFLRRENTGGLTVRVADRFGDYGLVGFILYEAEEERFKIDTFLLSCRVLGRGVEHTVLSKIGQKAISVGKKAVELICLPTERNLPAIEFVGSLSDQYRTDAGGSYVFPAEYLANLEYNPDEKSGGSIDKPKKSTIARALLPAAPEFAMVAGSEQLQRIGEQLYDTTSVAKAIDEFRHNAQSLDGVAETEPSNTIEAMVAKIWRKVLGRPRLPLNVNFFEAGGTSLKAVQVIGMIAKELKQNLSIVSLFECPTVKLLADRLSAKSESTSIEPNTTKAALRGQQRRSMAMRRTRSQ